MILMTDHTRTYYAHSHVNVSAPDGWIRFDFTNADEFKETYPAFCCLGRAIFRRCENWVRLLVEIVEHELSAHNPKLEALYHESLSGRGRPFFLTDKLSGLTCKQLSNGYYINVNADIPSLIRIIKNFCLYCGYTKEDIVMYGVPKNLTAPKTPAHPTHQTPPSSPQTHSSARTASITEKLEAYVLTLGIHGASALDIIDSVFPKMPYNPAAKALDDSPNIIRISADRYVHADSLVDLDEAAQVLASIIRIHFAQFSGYTNSQLIYGAASRELYMFLNDNAVNDPDSLFAVTKYLYGKKALYGKPLTFSAPHIFENPPDFPPTTRGLMIHLARLNNGILKEQDAANFLQKTMLAYAGINKLLQIGQENTFLFYHPEIYILTESLNINAEYCSLLHDRLDDLFRSANVAYVIPRDIRDSWLDTLPALPEGLSWTLLLLQDILRKFPAVGFVPITSGLSQTYSTIAAAFVPKNSPLETFADVVSLYMEERYTLPERMSGEALRGVLKRAGMIANNELMFSLHKALHDPRFSWTDHNTTVYVRGNRS